MNKALEQLKILLEQGTITQEDYDLAVSKLGGDNENPTPGDEDNPSDDGDTTENGNAETVTEEDSDTSEEGEGDELNNEEADPALDDETSENDPTNTEGVSDLPEDEATGEGDTNERILALLEDIQNRLTALEGNTNADAGANDNPNLNNDVSKNKAPLSESDYGPGIKTIYRNRR